MTETALQGKCLCGSVTVNAVAHKPEIGVCHCGICRKWGGGPAMVVDCKEVRWNGEEHIGVYDSSDWAQRGFCKGCGTHLFYRLKDLSFHSLPAGLFAEAAMLPLALEVFIDMKPENYAFANETEKMTEAEVFAAFGAS